MALGRHGRSIKQPRDWYGSDLWNEVSRTIGEAISDVELKLTCST